MPKNPATKGLKKADMAFVDEAEADKAGSKKRCRGKDIPEKAYSAMCNKLSPEQMLSVANRQDDRGWSLQMYVEEEIRRQGGENFKISCKWWQPMFDKFGLNETNIENSDGDIEQAQVRASLVDALEGVFSDNNFLRGIGLKQLSAECESTEQFNISEIKLVLQCAFNITSASRVFIDKVKWLALKLLSRNKAFLELPETWNEVKGSLLEVSARFFKSESDSGVHAKVFAKEHMDVLGAFCSVADVEAALEEKNDPKEMQAVMERLYEQGGNLMKNILAETQARLTFELWRESIKTAIAAWKAEPDAFADDKLKSIEAQLIQITLGYTAKVGRWSKSKVAIVVDFKGKQLKMQYNDWSMEWKLRLGAATREHALASGRLQPCPWEVALGWADKNDDVDIDIVPVILQKCNTARTVCLNFLGGERTTFFLMAKEIAKNKANLIGRDPTWLIEDTWVQQFGQGSLVAHCQEKALLVLPALGVHPTVDEVVTDLHTLLESDLVKMAGRTASDQLRSVLVAVQGIPTGVKPEVPASLTNAFYKEAYSLFPEFFSHEIVDDTPAAHMAKLAVMLSARKKKKLWGGLAMKACLADLAKCVAEDAKISIPTVKSIKAFTNYFDPKMLGQWEEVLAKVEKDRNRPQIPVSIDLETGEAMAPLSSGSGATLGAVKFENVRGTSSSSDSFSVVKRSAASNKPVQKPVTAARSKVLSFFKKV